MLAQHSSTPTVVTPLFPRATNGAQLCIEAQLERACRLAKQGNVLDAQDAFCQVLDQDETNLDALLSLAHLCRIGRHFSEALALIGEARRHHPHNPDAVAMIALVSLDIGYAGGARRLLRQLDKVCPDHPERETIAEGLRPTCALAS